MLTPSEFLKYCIIFGIKTAASGGGGGGQVPFAPNSIFWVATTGSASGNGSAGAPYDKVADAYAAGVASNAPFLVGLFPGTYSEPSLNLQLVPFSGFFAYNSETTIVTLGDVSLDLSAWSALGAGVVGKLGFYGATINANSWDLEVPSSNFGAAKIRDMIFGTITSGNMVWSNFNLGADVADTNFGGSNILMYGTVLTSSDCRFSSTTISSYNASVVSIGNCGWNSRGDTIGDIFLKCIFGYTNTVNLISPDARNLSSFFSEGDTITINKTANVKNPTITSGAPTINNVDLATNTYADTTRSNYTPTSATVEGNLVGIDAALGGAVGVKKVYLNNVGYVEVAPDTIYFVNSGGKVILQVPATFPEGSFFTVIGNSSTQCTWEVWTQLNQTLEYQDVVTTRASTLYAVATSNKYSDVATFTCTQTNVAIKCVHYDGAGLQINLINSVNIDIPTVTSNPGVLASLALVRSSYTGFLAKAIRTSDSATCYVKPDFSGRASLVSDIDIGGKLADWALGVGIDVQLMDQSGNGYSFTNSGQCLWIDAEGKMQNINGVPTVSTSSGANKFMQLAFPSDYILPQLTVIAMAARTAASYQSSIVTLYDPANGDDFASALNNVSFYEDNPPQDISVRNGNLSVKSRPDSLNVQMVLANRFNGSNNIMTINKVDGTTVASSGAFSFNRFLVGARYVSGGITTVGDYKIGLLALYPTALSLGEISTITDYINTYL